MPAFLEGKLTATNHSKVHQVHIQNSGEVLLSINRVRALLIHDFLNFLRATFRGVHSRDELLVHYGRVNEMVSFRLGHVIIGNL